MYRLYIGDYQFPVAPEKITITQNGKGKTYDLINGNEINVLKKSGLKTVSFELLLPNQQYPFAEYPIGFRNAWTYFGHLQFLMRNKKAERFLLTRSVPWGGQIYNENFLVSVEKIERIDSASNGTDCLCRVELKEYIPTGTKIFKISSKSSVQKSGSSRNSNTSPAPKINGISYTSQSGDTVFTIAKRFYGSSDARYQTAVYASNSGKIKNKNNIPAGTKLIIPVME